MLDIAVKSAGMHGLFDHVLSVDPVRQYKTAPAAYALGRSVRPAAGEILSSRPTAGMPAAPPFGYTTFWINRAGHPAERLDVAPTGTGHDMNDLLSPSLPPRRNGLTSQATLNTPSHLQEKTDGYHAARGHEDYRRDPAGYEDILTPEALALVDKLHRAFEPAARNCWPRVSAQAPRRRRDARLPAGNQDIREGDWKVAPVPKALECRRVEITGPVEAKMVINAFNSGADSYMTDFEDSNTPNWDNQIRARST
jgi:hypothetical protein